MGLSPGNHGVIVIHGIGEQKRGDIVAEFADSLATFLVESTDRESKKKHLKSVVAPECVVESKPVVQVEADIDSDPASVTLHIQAPNGDKANWICKEAYWADAFPPPSARSVIGWGIRKNLFVLGWSFWRIMSRYVFVLEDPLNRAFMGEMDDMATRVPLLAKPFYGIPLLFNSPNVEDVTPEKLPWWAIGFAPGIFFTHLVTGILLIPLALIAFVLLIVYWLISFLPFTIKPLEAIIEWIRKIDPFFSKSIGDLTQYVENTVWSANMRQRLEKVIISMLNDQHGDFQDITIVAHSMGCILAYETLSKGGNVAKEVEHLESYGRSKKITFVTVGSAINLAFKMAEQPKCSIQAHRRIIQPLAPEITRNQIPNMFLWKDIYARLDPVPAGRLRTKIIKFNIDENSLRLGQVERRKVVNKDDLFFDHNSYWQNQDTVMPRIANAINGGDYPWDAARVTEKKLNRNFKGLVFGSLLKDALAAVVAIVIIFLPVILPVLGNLFFSK